ncbi:toxin-antitoxin system YwqK family antitoxin [Nocardia sp. NPDC004722]
MNKIDYSASRDEIATDDDLRLTFRGEPFTGEVVETIGDQLLTQEFYVDGVPHGPDREWWADGSLKSEGEVVYGRPQGTWRSWHPNGQIAEEREFNSKGHLTTVRKWDEDGNPIGR